MARNRAIKSDPRFDMPSEVSKFFSQEVAICYIVESDMTREYSDFFVNEFSVGSMLDDSNVTPTKRAEDGKMTYELKAQVSGKTLSNVTEATLKFTSIPFKKYREFLLERCMMYTDTVPPMPKMCN